VSDNGQLGIFIHDPNIDGMLIASLTQEPHLHGTTPAWNHTCMEAHLHGSTPAWKHTCMEAHLHGTTPAWNHTCMEASAFYTL
jgi:hypothetical protein